MKTIKLKPNLKCEIHNVSYFSCGKCPRCEAERLDNDLKVMKLPVVTKLIRTMHQKRLIMDN